MSFELVDECADELGGFGGEERLGASDVVLELDVGAV
jgi:hypothetical protein